MKAVITGGLGFVGAALTDRLASAGADLLVIDDESIGNVRNLAASGGAEIRVEHVDLLDGRVLARVLRDFRPEVIFHLAAIHFIPACERNPERAIRVNVEGTQALVSAADGLRLSSFIFTSSAAVYKPSPLALSEESSLGPTDTYGLTKLWGEHILTLKLGAARLPLGIARLFNVYGPGETNPHLIPEVVRQLVDGPTLSLGDLSTERDYVFRDDVAEGLYRLALSTLDRQGETVLNLGTGQAQSGRTVVAALSRLLRPGAPVDLVTDEAKVRPVDRPVLLADYRRANSLLGWMPTVDFAEGLSAVVRRPFAYPAAG